MQVANRLRAFALPIAVGCLVGHADIARADSELSLHQLIENSDFVGMVFADPNLGSTRANTESVFIYSAEPFKGTLTHITPTQFSYINAQRQEAGPFPMWFAERAEYLVFLRCGSKQGEPYWTTRAVYRVDYRADATGMVTGRVFNRAMAVDEVRKLVQQECLTGLPVSAAESRIAPLLATSGNQDEPPTTYEDTLKLAKILIADVKQGTTRGDFEKIFRRQDGGAMGSVTRYYFGNNVMVHVPYEATGGPFSSMNRIDGEITITRNMMHYD